MRKLADRRVREALAALASRAQPAAAGVASALSCAAAAALVELTAGLAADRLASEGSGARAGTDARLRELAARAAELVAHVLDIADEDAAAYAQALGARTAADRARALSGASEPPLAIAECAAEVAEAAAETARAGGWAFQADAIVAAELAMAAARGAASLVAVNLAGSSEDPSVARARAAADRAERASRAAATAGSD